MILVNMLNIFRQSIVHVCRTIFNQTGFKKEAAHTHTHTHTHAHTHTHIYIYIYIYTRHEQDAILIFKHISTGLNSLFSFSLTGCHRYAKSQSTLLSCMENWWIHIFPKDTSTIWNANSLIKDLYSGRHVHSQQR